MNKFILISCFCIALVACQHSPQKNYYYLTATNGNNTETNRTEKAAGENSTITQLIGIGPIEIPEYLSRSQIIDNQTNNTLAIADNAYWAEPLDKSIARVISRNLIQMNSTRSFVDFPWRSDSKPRYSLRVHIDELSRSGKTASIKATWELVDNNSKTTILRHHFVRSLTADAGAKGLAQAYSQLLAELSAEMDSALTKNP